MSPTYETAEDRANQTEILERFRVFMGFTSFRETPAKHEFDAVMYRGEKPIAIVEAKLRKTPFDRFEDYIIDVEKLDKMIAFVVSKKAIAYLAISWLGDLRYLEVPWKHNFPAGPHTRIDRGTRRLVYHVPLDIFAKIEAVAEQTPLWTHEQYCAGCYEVSPGVNIHPPRNGGPRTPSTEGQLKIAQNSEMFSES